MTFQGFSAETFAVFCIPDFPGRMAGIRQLVRPRLLELGSDLADHIADASGTPAFAHAAQHMRRRVNPPKETWAAFARDKKGYKRWTHFRVAVSETRLRTTVFIEDDADDKPIAATGLGLHGARLVDLGLSAPEIAWEVGIAAADQFELAAPALAELGEVLESRKLARLQVGISVPSTTALNWQAAEQEQWMLECVERLMPVYLLGITGSPDK